MITLQHFPKIRAPEIFRQIHSIKVPPPGIDRGKVPVQKCKTVHIAWLLPPIGRSLLLGLYRTMVWHVAWSGRPPAASHPLSVLEPSPPPGTTLAYGQPLQLRDAAQEPATRPHATHAGDGDRPNRPCVELSGVYLAACAYRSGPGATDGSPY